MKTTEFKDSELGPIPKEWEVRRLGECAKRIGVGLATSVTQYYRDKGVPLFRNLNIKPGLLDDEDILYLDSDFAKSQPGKLIHANDVLSVHTGYVGISCIVPEKYEGALTFTTLVTTTDTAVLLPEYLVVFMNSWIGAAEVSLLQSSGGRSNLNVADFEKLRIATPPLAEQRRIAEVLGKTDEYIEALKKLIEKRKNVKRGAMQELLSGKRRLPGFEGKWVEKRLGEIGDFVGGGTPSTSVDIYWGGDIDWYTPAEIGDLKYVSCSERKITREGLVNSSARLLPVGAILLTTRASIGLRAILQREAATNQGFQSLIVNEKGDSEFMYYFLSTAVEEMESRASGSTFLEISSSKLKEIPIMLPPTLSEQKAIAKVLSEMDEGIEALEKKLKKVEAIKEGMMQDLLTGKVRLK